VQDLISYLAITAACVFFYFSVALPMALYRYVYDYDYDYDYDCYAPVFVKPRYTLATESTASAT